MRFEEGDVVEWKGLICKILIADSPTYCLISPFSNKGWTGSETISDLRLTVDPHTYETKLKPYDHCFDYRYWVKLKDLTKIEAISILTLEELVNKLEDECSSK